MTVPDDVLTSLCARHLEPRVGFGASFSHSWLDTSRPMADLALSDRGEQTLAVIRAGKSSRDPRCPHSCLSFIVGVWQLRTSMPVVVLRLRRSSSTFQRRAYSAERSALLTRR